MAMENRSNSTSGHTRSDPSAIQEAASGRLVLSRPFFFEMLAMSPAVRPAEQGPTREPR